MSDTRRPWFRFHLFTLAVLMVVASGLVWANIRIENEPGKHVFTPEYKSQGWPFWFRRVQGESQLERYLRLPDEEAKSLLQWNRIGLFANCLTALAILSALAAGFEWWQRESEETRA